MAFLFYFILSGGRLLLRLRRGRTNSHYQVLTSCKSLRTARLQMLLFTPQYQTWSVSIALVCEYFLSVFAGNRDYSLETYFHSMHVGYFTR